MIQLEELPTPWPSFIPIHGRADLKELPRILAVRQFAGRLWEAREFLAAFDASTAILARIDRTICELEIWSKYTDRQLESIVLSMIEDRHLYLAGEMVDALNIDRRLVVEILNRLESRQVVYKVRRFVPKSGRPQWMYKSNRMANIEATYSLSDLKGSNYEYEADERVDSLQYGPKKKRMLKQPVARSAAAGR